MMNKIICVLALAVLGVSASPNFAKAVESNDDAKIASQKDARLSNDMLWLSKNIYYEARGQSQAGQAAVGYVTLNRVKNSGKSIQSVVTARSGRTCQFSWVCHGIRIPHGKDWELAKKIASDVINGRIPNPIGKATHFHSVRINPGWRGLRYITTLGGHKFYQGN